MSSIPLYIPAPYQDSAEFGRLILRDGSTATVRVAAVQDAEAMSDFFPYPNRHPNSFVRCAILRIPGPSSLWRSREEPGIGKRSLRRVLILAETRRRPR